MVEFTTLKLVGTPRLGITGAKKYEIDVAKEAVNAERAKHNIEQMEALEERIVELLRKKFRFNPFAMEADVEERDLVVEGTKIADVRGECRYRKTPYKSIVNGMEDHLNGILFNAKRGRHMTDVVKRDCVYVHAGRLLEDFDITMAGNLNLGIEYNVIPAIVCKQPGETLIVPADADRELSANSIRLLMQIRGALPLEQAYLRKYNKEAAKGAPKNGVNVTEVSSRKVIEGGVIEKDTADYMDIVRTLIPVPTENHEKEWDPELPYLVDERLTLKDKQGFMPWYELCNGRNGERLGVYVGVKSLYDRIQELKEGNTQRIKVPYAEVKKVF